MSYKIEINADSISELSGKLLALAAQMQATPVDPVMPEVREAPKPKRTKGKAETDADTATGTDTTTAPEAAPPQTAQPDTAPVEQPETESAEVDAPVVSLDFEKDVAPLVLKAVAVKGKPWVQEVLAQFGVERASQVPDDRLPELVAIVAEAV